MSDGNAPTKLAIEAIAWRQAPDGALHQKHKRFTKTSAPHLLQTAPHRRSGAAVVPRARTGATLTQVGQGGLNDLLKGDTSSA